MNNEIITSFIVGGTLLATITYFVKYIEPALAALVWAAPVILIPSVILLWYNNVSNEKISNFILISIPYLMLTVVWQFSFILIIKYTHYLNDPNGVLKTTIISVLIWLFLALIFYYSKLHIYLKIK